MHAKKILEHMSFGASVAEHDNDLKDYFVQTSTFNKFVSDQGDVVAGDKGTGKSAIYRVLKENYRSYPQLENVELVDTFNLQGNSIFQRISQLSDFDEGQLRTLWKSYVFSLVGNWLLDVFPADYSEETRKLSDILEMLDLKSADPAPSTIFSKLIESVKRLRSLETTFSVTETGMPIVVPKVTFGTEVPDSGEVYCDDFLQDLSKAVEITGYEIWLLFDRLDEAFAGQPDIEIPALRALLRTYLDLVGLPNIKLKLFLRRDLFRRIVEGGFVNLTHVNARTIEIVWDDEDLWSMVARRLARNQSFVALWDEEPSAEQILNALLPDQIDVGEKQSTSQKWILNRIEDGNKVKPPRNMIDLLNDALEAQVRKESREEREVDPTVGPLLEAQSIKRAFAQLSEKRVYDTLLAEAGAFADFIKRFKDGKAEHNLNTLAEIIQSEKDFDGLLQGLVDLGFLEQERESFKIPMLYRAGLGVKQGKAFAK